MQNEISEWFLNTLGSDWFYYLVMGYCLYRLCIRQLGRSRTYNMLAYFIGLVALAGGVVLFFLNPRAISSLADAAEFLRLFLIGIGVFVGGIFIVGFLLRASIRQRKFEWRVDRFHDAWRSRNDRWYRW